MPLKLCQYADEMLVTQPIQILFVYTHYQEAFNKLLEQTNNITFTQTLPSEEELRYWTVGKNHSLLVIDNKAEETGTNPLYEVLITRLSHHLSMSVVLLVQSGAMQGKFSHPINRNTHMNILMRTPREFFILRSIGTALNKYKLIREAYESACNEQMFGYLCIESHLQANAEYQLRTSIF